MLSVLPAFSQNLRSAMYNLVQIIRQEKLTECLSNACTELWKSMLCFHFGVGKLGGDGSNLSMGPGNHSLAHSWQSVLGVCKAMNGLCLFGTNIPKEVPCLWKRPSLVDLQDVLFFVELNYPQQSFYNKQVKDLTSGLGKRNECIVEHVISVYCKVKGSSL